MEGFRERIQKSLSIIRDSSYITAFTGAGISTESGIPDFRSPGGVWERYRIVTYQEFLSSSEARKYYWKMKKEFTEQLLRCKPNRAHTALAELEKMGLLKAVITQNIDALHHKAGNSPEKIIELHGTNLYAHCIQCGKRYLMEEVIKILEDVNYEPRCDECNGLLKPSTVAFGEPMPEDEMKRALEEATKTDLMFMIGSSLQVEPAASIPRFAYHRGAKLIFINRAETPYDYMATVYFREPASEVMDALLNGLKDLKSS
ncbi:MAG: NAD-dependent deacylase [Nitrospirae bacterium]|nr:MAG: NAD-dependent deacylase [Nitrospirota bacterium]